MSGLEVVAAITSIIALAEFSQKVLAKAADLRVSGKDVGEAFESIRDLLPPISHAVKRTKERVESGEIDEQTCAALIPIHRGVERTLAELRTILQKYTVNENASKVEVLWKAGKSVFHEKKVKGILQRLHEYVGVLTLSHAEAAHAGSFSSTEKDNIQQILTNIAQLHISQSATTTRKCRNLLSLDGGGLRGLSILYILLDLMAKVNERQDPPLRPCEIFDLIGGSGTGGLIAIMLGRLGMTVEECLEEYLKLFERLSTRQEKTVDAELGSAQMIKSSILRATVSELVVARGLLPTTKLRSNENVSCYTFVCATAQASNTIVHFQNYVLPGEQDRRPATIMDAACATLSSAKVFEPVEFGRPPSKYIAGELGANNPIDRVWNEAQRIWSKRGGFEYLVSCVISIGAGSSRSRAISTDDHGFAHAMYDIAVQTEETAKKFRLRNADLGGKDPRYHRFHVHNLPELGWEGYSDSGVIKEYTDDYLEGHGEGVEQCAEHLQRDQVPSDGYKASWIMPFERNLRFTGRTSQLAQLEEKLFAEDQTARIAIIGLGGVGKTQLAIELVYRARSKYNNCSIIWMPAMSTESLQLAYLDVAKQLGIPGWEDDKMDVKRLVQAYLSKESAGQWLLVFDNADDIDMWIHNPRSEPNSSSLIDYLPRSRQGCIIFTTRDRKTAVKLVHQNIVEVSDMSEEVATELLQKYLVKQDLVDDEQNTKALLTRLACLPLAIVQAAAYINENDIAIADYLSLLDDQEEEVIDLLSEEFEDDGRYRNGKYHDVKNPVATTWLISFERIRRRVPLAAEYLSFIACVDPKNVPLSLLPPGSSQKNEIEAMGTLCAYSFIIRRSTDAAIDVHRLVHLATRNWLRKEELLRQWTERAVTRLNELFPDDQYYNRSVCRKYLVHAQCALKSSLTDKYGEKRIDLAWKLGLCLYNEGRFNEAEGLIEEVMETYKAVFGAEHHDTLTSMNNLAALLQAQGKYDEAEPLFLQTLQLRGRILGLEHPDTLMSMNNLAALLKAQGKWDEAEPLYLQTLPLNERVLGLEHPHTLTSMNNLAFLLMSQGKYDKAEPLYKETLQLRGRILGLEHPDTLMSMNNLAALLKAQGKWDEAEPLYLQTLQLRGRVLGLEHPSTLTSMNNLASLLESQRKYDMAEPLFQQTLQLRERVLGPEHPNTLSSMNNLAGLFVGQGKYGQAEPLCQQTLQLSERVLGLEHPSTLTSMNNLASLLESQRKYDMAEPLFQQTLQLRERVLGLEHPSTLTSMNNLASLLESQGKYDMAEPLFQQTLQLRERVLGPEHPDTLSSMYNLASILQQQGNISEAKKLFQEELARCELVYGPDSTETLSSRRNLANMLEGYEVHSYTLVSKVLDSIKVR